MYTEAASFGHVASALLAYEFAGAGFPNRFELLHAPTCAPTKQVEIGNLMQQNMFGASSNSHPKQRSIQTIIHFMIDTTLPSSLQEHH